MFSFLRLTAYTLLLANLLTSCANIQAPTGGERDTTPPRIDTTQFHTPNLSTRFNASQIVLPFDEWVVLNDVLNQVVVSPPLSKPIQVGLKKKTVIVDLSQETLRPNTTYTINFGNAIKDFTEGNVPQDFRFIFSTGSFIDSLAVRGFVRNALTNEPTPNALVLLYDDLTDSTVYKERPYYFAKTKEDGSFLIPNVKRDTFKVVALLDANFNYLYDLPTEQIAYSDQPFRTGDSLQEPLELRIFQAQLSPQCLTTQVPHYGLIRFVFNTPDLANVTLTPLSPFPNLRYLLEPEKDTLRFWYTNTELDSLSFLINHTDTLTVLLPSKSIFLNKKNKLKLSFSNNKLVQNPESPMVLTFNRPIETIDLDKIELWLDTVRLRPNVRIDSLHPRQIFITQKWKDEAEYRLAMQQGGVTDWFGVKNDSMEVTWKVKPRKDFGNVLVTAEGLDSSKAYIVQLLNKSNDVVQEFVTQGQTTASQKFLALNPSDYKIRVITDENRNQLWDTGNYPFRQPEEVTLSAETTTLRPNWELDLKIILK